MEISLETLGSRRGSSDLLISGYFENEKLYSAAAEPDLTFAVHLKHASEKGRFEGKFGQIFSSYIPENKETSEIAVFGLGLRKNYKHACLRKAAGQIIKFAQSRNMSKIRVLLDSFVSGEVSQTDAAEIFTEISLLATYEFVRYKFKKKDAKEKKKIASVILVTEDGKHKKQNLKEIEYAKAVADGVITARDLINEPANIMTPEQLVKEAEKLAEKKNISCDVLSEGEMEQLGMGGILGVGRGSKYRSGLIVLEYGKRHKKNGTVCIVGKGVTFDTGGISIKPADSMEKMKYDMSGAAAVIGTMGVVSDLKLPLHVVGLAPVVENNVAEDPQRPGDIIKMLNGKTVEILNTDAEGRLILGDALSYAKKFQPDAIIDLATLTGMCAATFGDKCIAVMGNNEKLMQKVKDAGAAAGERCWELPMFDEYGEQIKGSHSDLVNIGGRYGGTITAAKFLQEFVPEKTAWVHMDIAGTAWSDSGRYDCPKGGTGVGVRLLTRFLSDYK